MLNSVKHIVLHHNKVAAKTPLSQIAVRELCTLFGTILYAGVALAQTVTGGTLYINGSFINAGNISVNNHIVNNTSGPVSVLPGATNSRVTLAGATNAAGHSIFGGGAISFYRLDLRGSRETRLKVNVQITNLIEFGFGANAYTAPDSGFTIENNTFTIDSAATYLASSTANLTFAGGSVLYDNSNVASQTLLSRPAVGIRYGTLSLSGTSAKTLPSTGTDSAATLTQTGGQLSLTGNLDVTGTGSFANIGAISAAKKLRFTTTATSGTVTSMNNSNTGTLENASNATVTIATLAGNTGTINQSGASGTISFTNAAASNGTITNSSTGTITFANNLTGTGTINQTTNGIINVGGLFTQNTYTLTGGTVVYNSGTAGQSVIGTIYNNLTLTSNSKTAAGTMTINGNLIISGGTFADAGYQIIGNATGTMSMAAGTGLTLGSAGTGTSFPSNFTNAHISLGATTTVTYNSNQAQTVSSVPTYGHLTLNGNSKTAAGTMTINGNFTISGGTFADAGYQITGNATGTMSMAAGTGLTLGSAGTGTSFPTNFTNAHISLGATSTVTYNSNQAQTVAAIDYRNLTFSVGGTKQFQAGTTNISEVFTISGASADATTNNTTINFNGSTAQIVPAIDYFNLSLSTSGTKTFASGTTRIAGNLTVSGATGDGAANSTTIEFNGTGAQTIGGTTGTTFNILSLSNSGTKTINNIQSGTDVTAATLNVLSGSGVVTNSGDIVVGSGGMTISGATTQVNNNGTITINGDINNDGILTNTGTMTVN